MAGFMDTVYCTVGTVCLSLFDSFLLELKGMVISVYMALRQMSDFGEFNALLIWVFFALVPLYPS